MMDLKELKEEKDIYVVKGNEIIQQAKYSLSTVQLRLLNFAFAQIKPDDAEDSTYILKFADYADIVGIQKNSRNEVYTRIKKQMQILDGKSFYIKSVDGKKDQLCHWISDVEVYENEGKVSFKFHKFIRPYVFGLIKRGNYTQYSFLETARFKHANSIRIYELLKSYSFNHKEIPIGIDELKEQLGITGMYDDYRAFRRRILEPAVKEINSYTELYVSFRKASERKVDKLIWTIEKKEDFKKIESGKKSLPAPKKKTGNKQVKNQFNNIEQHDYDFDAIEEAITK